MRVGIRNDLGKDRLVTMIGLPQNTIVNVGGFVVIVALWPVAIWPGCDGVTVFRVEGDVKSCVTSAYETSDNRCNAHTVANVGVRVKVTRVGINRWLSPNEVSWHGSDPPLRTRLKPEQFRTLHLHQFRHRRVCRKILPISFIITFI